LDDVAKSDLLLLVGPTYDNANHAVENELRLLPIDQYFHLLKALEFFLVTIQRKIQKVVKKDLTRFFCENAK